MLSCTRSFTKCDDLYSEISIEFRSFVWGEYITYLLGGVSTWSRIVHSLLISKTVKYSNFGG